MTLEIYDKNEKIVIENVVHVYSAVNAKFYKRLHIEYKLQDNSCYDTQCDDIVIKE